jgi:thiamine biosynthesis protein ThiS
VKAPWPGNVRELENCVERAVVLCRADEITASDLELESVRDAGALEETLKALLSGNLTLDGLERSILIEALRRCDGNLSKTARSLGISASGAAVQARTHPRIAAGDRRMNLRVNGVDRSVDSGLSVCGLLDALGIPRAQALAVERNREVVPRPAWDAVALADGDEVEIVSLVGGG